MLELRVTDFGLQLVVDGGYTDPHCSGQTTTQQAMTQTSLDATSISAGDFRMSAVISRSASMLRRHFLSFFVVGLIASWPIILQSSTLTAELRDQRGPSYLA